MTCVSVAASLEPPNTRPPNPENEDKKGQGETSAVNPNTETYSEDAHLRLALLSSILTTLTRSFEDNLLNRNHFRSTIGFDALTDAIKLSNLLSIDNAEYANDKIFGVLLAFLLDLSQERSAKELFVNLRHLQASSETDDERTQDDLLKEEIDNFLNFPARIVNADVAGMLISFLRDCEELKLDTFLRKATMLLLCRLTQQSRRNTILIAKAGLLDVLLDWLYPLCETRGESMEKGKERAQQHLDGTPITGQLNSSEREILADLAQSLFLLGVSTQSICHMVKRVVVRPTVVDGASDTPAELDKRLLRSMYDGLRASRWPPFLHFDLSACPYAAVSLPTFANRQFPPFNNNGYTFLAWIHIDRFPQASDSPGATPNANVPSDLHMLNIQDEKEQCAIRLFVRFASRTLALQTATHSVTQFPNAYLEEGRWYHLAVIHHRGSRSVPSCASVYLDGKKMDDRVPCTWPVQPEKGIAVSASLGLPRQLAKSLGYLGKSFQDGGIWSIGPTWLLDLEMHEEMVYIGSTLGPRYTNNFQDRLGQYQTYLSSTQLNLRLESIYGNSKQAGNSPLVTAVRGKAAAFVPANRIYFALHAGNVISAGQASSHPVTAGLAESTRKSIDAVTASKGRILLNSAISEINTALRMPLSDGIAVFEGEVASATPKGMDNAFDKIGGMPFICRLVELAKDSEELELAINVWEETFASSWRMSEDAERSQTFEVLGMLCVITRKRRNTPFQTLTLSLFRAKSACQDGLDHRSHPQDIIASLRM